MEVMRDPPALDVERITRRPAGIDAITFENDDLVPYAGEREGRCEPRDAAASDNEPHASKLSGRTDRRQIDPQPRRRANIAAIPTSRSSARRRPGAPPTVKPLNTDAQTRDRSAATRPEACGVLPTLNWAVPLERAFGSPLSSL